MVRRLPLLATAITATIAMTVVLLANDDKRAESGKPQFAGKTDRGFLLPNGWTISPAGNQVALDRPAAQHYPVGRRPPCPGGLEWIQRPQPRRCRPHREGRRGKGDGQAKLVWAGV